MDSEDADTQGEAGWAQTVREQRAHIQADVLEGCGRNGVLFYYFLGRGDGQAVIMLELEDEGQIDPADRGGELHPGNREFIQRLPVHIPAHAEIAGG